MTTVMFVESSGAVVLQISTVEAIPNTGDVIVTPDNTVYRVVQRAFIASTQPTVGFQPKKFVDVTVQCAVIKEPIKKEANNAANK